MHQIPPEAQRLADHLRKTAEEIESAARYGVPIPDGVGVHEFLGASFFATEAQFDAWAEYTEAVVDNYDHADQHWSRAEVDCNGLRLSFATVHEAEAAS